MRNRAVSHWRLPRMTSRSPPNSHKICRQAPHGGVGASASATMAMRVNWRNPSEIALKTATRSAKTVNPYVAFSTLQSATTRPSAVSSAAPTWNPEYRACACSRAARAMASRSVTLTPSECFEHQRGLRNRLVADRPGPCQQLQRRSQALFAAVMHLDQRIAGTHRGSGSDLQHDADGVVDRIFDAIATGAKQHRGVAHLSGVDALDKAAALGMPQQVVRRPRH